MPEAMESAVRLLARREHSARELWDKLKQRGYNSDEADTALQNCQRLGLQSDLRFAQSLIRHRAHQGYGPLRIRQELKFKGINAETASLALDETEINWKEEALKLVEKKGCVSEVHTLKSLLHTRGFGGEIVRELLDCI